MSEVALVLIPSAETVPVTKDDLERLLVLRVEAHKRYSAAHQAVARYTSTDTVDDARIEADIEKAVALKASCAADEIYDQAIQAYCKSRNSTHGAL